MDPISLSNDNTEEFYRRVRLNPSLIPDSQKKQLGEALQNFTSEDITEFFESNIDDAIQQVQNYVVNMLGYCKKIEFCLRSNPVEKERLENKIKFIIEKIKKILKDPENAKSLS